MVRRGGEGGANLAGLVWADELAAATGNEKYADLLVQTADRYRSSHDNGVPTPSNPTYQVEDMFFTAAVLGRAFKLTGDEAYLNILTRFLLDANVQQADGLFWHDRRTPFYWGRGNGFAALSYAETLTYLPDNHRQRAAVLAIHRRHLHALREFQHRSGMWRQLIDGPGSYPEMTVTCMVGYALARGLRRGWLDADHRDPLLRAWLGVAAPHRRPRRPRRRLHRHRRPAKHPRLPRPPRHIRPRRTRRRPINLVRHRNGDLSPRVLTSWLRT